MSKMYKASIAMSFDYTEAMNEFLYDCHEGNEDLTEEEIKEVLTEWILEDLESKSAILKSVQLHIEEE